MPLTERAARLDSSITEADLPSLRMPAFRPPLGFKHHMHDDASKCKKNESVIKLWLLKWTWPLSFPRSQFLSQFIARQSICYHCHYSIRAATPGSGWGWPPKPLYLLLLTNIYCGFRESFHRYGTSRTGWIGGRVQIPLGDRVSQVRSRVLKGWPFHSRSSHWAGHIAAAPVEAAASSALSKHTPQPSAFRALPSVPYNDKLQRCWPDSKVFSHLPSNCRALAAMRYAAQ